MADYIRKQWGAVSDILAIDWIKALWADARAETDPARRAQLERDAAVMEDAWNRSKYSLAATKDQITAALGNASLNLAERLDDVVTGQRTLDARVGEIHQHVQEGHLLISTFVESFPTQFAVFQTEMRSAVQENARGLKKLEQGQIEYNARLDEVDARHGGQWEEALTLYRDLKAQQQRDEARLDRKRLELDQLNAEVAALKEFQASIEDRIRRTPTEDETRELIDLVRKMAAERGV